MALGGAREEYTCRTRHNARVNPGRRLRLPSLRPRSLRGLVLLGFAAVVLPLLLGTLGAAIEMRNLAQASERLVANGVAATQYTQSLVRQVASLERTARLYQILRRPGLLTIFQKNSTLLGTTLDGLEDLPGDPARAAVIGRMRTGITAIDQGLASQHSARISGALRQFTQLSRDAGELSRLASRQTDRELKALRAETDNARKRILWQTTMLVPVTIGLVLLFTLFLARPIRRIDDAIGRIGHGRLDEPVIEEGPTDLARSRASSNGCACASSRSPRSATASCATCRTNSRRRSRTSAKARTSARGRRRRRSTSRSARSPASCATTPRAAAPDREPAVLQRVAVAGASGSTSSSSR